MSEQTNSIITEINAVAPVVGSSALWLLLGEEPDLIERVAMTHGMLTKATHDEVMPQLWEVFIFGWADTNVSSSPLLLRPHDADLALTAKAEAILQNLAKRTLKFTSGFACLQVHFSYNPVLDIFRFEGLNAQPELNATVQRQVAEFKRLVAR